MGCGVLNEEKDFLGPAEPYKRIAELEAALRPFADMADKLDDGQETCEIVHVKMEIGAFVAAREALEK